MRRHLPYGHRRDYPKIDIYVNGNYFASTTWARTCKQAKEELVKKYNLAPSQVECVFAERS